MSQSQILSSFHKEHVQKSSLEDGHVRSSATVSEGDDWQHYGRHSEGQEEWVVTATHGRSNEGQSQSRLWELGHDDRCARDYRGGVHVNWERGSTRHEKRRPWKGSSKGAVV